MTEEFIREMADAILRLQSVLLKHNIDKATAISVSRRTGMLFKSMPRGDFVHVARPHERKGPGYCMTICGVDIEMDNR